MGKSLIIVESPAKARTLQKHLGKDYLVKASVGHIRDLPVSSLGVDIDHDFAPQYVTIKGKAKVISDLKKAAKEADQVYLAPDPDREGEAIAYHIAEALKTTRKPIRRVLFHELTHKAVLAALEKSGEVDHHLFEAQQARRVLDRLVGYQISPLLWDKVRRGLSAGRVQSVAVRMVCEREEEIEKFVSEEYWSITTTLAGPQPPPFQALLEKVDGRKLDNRKRKIADEAQARELVLQLMAAELKVAGVDKKQQRRRPSPPFITSTMQMDANRKLRFSAKKTMAQAQRLYEGIDLGKEGPVGLITYMRTDSTRVNDEALGMARDYIGSTYGADYLPAKPVQYKTGKGAQDAHEAIRPTDVSRTPESLAGKLDKDMLALYTLIWKRFVASQMAPAIYDQTSIRIAGGPEGRHELKATGSIMRFPGFMTLYVEAVDETPEEGKQSGKGGKDALLPDLQEGQLLKLNEITPKQHFTQPPPRYTEATLVKALEENGVGRPSTYAAILSTIVDKEYVRLTQRKFYPTDLGRMVNKLLVAHFPKVIDTDFTAKLEQELDEIETGKVDWVQVMREFYGPFQQNLEQAREEMKAVKHSAIPTGLNCPQCESELVIKWGRKGEFLACSNYPECKHTQDFTRDEEGKIKPLEREAPEESGESCDKCGKPMVYKHGRFGKFLACSGYPDCKNVRAISTGVSCPEDGCDGEIVQKVSKRGKVFYSCNRYPKCTYALWDKPVAKPCPLCSSPFLVEKSSKKGRRLACPNKECRYSEELPEEGE
ncbi:type I DNA topoisomerase [Desulfurivibrio alkaliphilus]|uniref:DNA topoisomerase 1 n=1 Tax=Desulfurivibrio alkaliphilus (strain DSM 19089 / UNIQEM U267 / AHT2) TaxID=589865 RepID=D6Z6Z6_DESAT|nr:type I DNA topoisomerase [Desulfurivibrio alkaliphilus]ADH86983.1 DNA topoisomerase I [Desulfurivibrio alkaliphilus AHT 2]